LIVEKLDLVDYRNIAKESLLFNDTFNVITGSNAAGKTNLLEAIHIFSLGRSFRTRRTSELVMFGKDYFFLRLHGRSDGGVRFKLELGQERNGRAKVSVNGKTLSGVSEILGFMPSVVFTPDDVGLTSGPPVLRRMFLDYTAAQISHAFLVDLKEYRRILKQRNRLLREISTGRDEWNEELNVWNGMLVEKGGSVARGRAEMLEVLEGRAREIFGEIVRSGEKLSLDYMCSFNPEGEDYCVALKEALERNADGERKRGYTLAGPHYDDMIVSLGSEELRRYGSQGRRRLVAIVLKLTQAGVIMEKRGERPVVLLDDIFSELDGETAEGVGRMLSDKYQSFITSPRKNELPCCLEDTAFYAVENGRFERE
jgi:DNA replication and repair protein RecF